MQLQGQVQPCRRGVHCGRVLAGSDCILSSPERTTCLVRHSVMSRHASRVLRSGHQVACTPKHSWGCIIAWTGRVITRGCMIS